MSWLDRVQNDLIITCGDGKSFRPSWLNASKAKEYNIAAFEFAEVSGTLVSRGLPKGRRYALEIYFQGDNCIEDSADFERSADDSRAWTITHPFYGTLIVQPMALEFDNSRYNVTKINAMVVETITEDSPKGSVDPVDKITFDQAQLGAVFAQAYANNVIPTSVDVALMTTSNRAIFNLAIPSIKVPIDAENYFNAFNAANTAFLTLASAAFNAMNLFQAVINAPALFINSVQIRLQVLREQFDSLRTAIFNLSEISPTHFDKNAKKADEHNRGCVISAMALAAITDTDYQNRQQVVDTIEFILDTYNQYIADLDEFQSDNGGNPDAYIPDADSLIGLNNLMNFTVASLFDIALNSKQERTIYCEKDTNILILAHRLYGLSVDDSTIDIIIATNNLGLFELLQIKKGRKIIWYV